MKHRKHLFHIFLYKKKICINSCITEQGLQGLFGTFLVNHRNDQQRTQIFNIGSRSAPLQPTPAYIGSRSALLRPTKDQGALHSGLLLPTQDQGALYNGLLLPTQDLGALHSGLLLPTMDLGALIILSQSPHNPPEYKLFS